MYAIRDVARMYNDACNDDEVCGDECKMVH